MASGDHLLLLLNVLEAEMGENEDDDGAIAEEAAFLMASIREDHVKVFNYIEHTIPQYLPQQFKRFFRFERSTFDKLCQLLFSHTAFELHGWGGREPLDVPKQILIFMWYICSQDTISEISDRFAVTDFSVLQSRKRVMEALLSLMPQVIKWLDAAEYREIAQKFKQENRFPGTIGAIDGSHIRIKAPHINPQDYVNRKKYHSVVLQAVCLGDARFSDVFIGYPGSVHDSRVLRNSPIYQRVNDFGEHHIIGDGGYPLKTWLMVGFRDNGHLSPEQKNFNFKLSQSRQVIERAFGHMKGRLRRLQFIDVKSMSTLVELISVGCTLHNLFIINNDEFPEYYEEINPNAEFAEAAVNYQRPDDAAERKRERIMNTL